MKKIILPFIALLLMTAACNSKKDNLKSGIDLTNLDKSVSPKVDFYQYACGGWMEKNPLTPEYSRFGSFDKLAEDNREQLRVLIEDIASKTADKGAIEQKIGDLYNMAMDEAKLNSDGYAPIIPALNRIAAIQDKAELSTLIPDLMLSGTTSYFQVYVDADPMNSSQYLLQTYQGGISLGEREYYIDTDDHTTEIRNQYKQHVKKMFELTGHTPELAQKNMEDVLRIETRLAKAAYDNVELRDPYANYNKMTIDELQKIVPAINWNDYMSALGLNVNELSVSQKESLVEVGRIIESEPLKAQIAYIQWKLIDAAASDLSDDLFNQNFEFYGKILSGKEEPSPRWKRAVSTVNGVLGEAVGQMYVKQFFPPAAKERMLGLVKNLQVALGERIDALDWMGEETKVKAHEKLNSFHVKIGYPDKWRDYSSLEINPEASYYENLKHASKFEYEYMLAKAGKKVDVDEWLMTPQTVNAYYNPTTNEICFPAGILQYPFFDMEADDAFNYGAIGVVIGHEMTHGFDDQGRQFDKDGNLKDWWTEEDAKRFEERAQVMIDFFDAIEVAPGVHANGRFTLGENIADYGGLQISYQALQNATKNAPLAEKDGLTPEQRFFLAYSNVWAGNIRPEEILVRTKSDPHSLGKWRVNGALPQIGAWYEAFDVKEGDPMFVPADKRVYIW